MNIHRERLGKTEQAPLKRRMAIAVATGALAMVAACHGVGSGHSEAPKSAVVGQDAAPRCDSKPLPSHPANPPRSEAKAHTLQTNLAGEVTNLPQMTAEMQKRLKHATVEMYIPTVDGPTLYGTGFLVKDKKGNTDVVTAAHVIAGHPINTIEVVDADKNVNFALKGCIMYEKDGTFQNPPKDTELSHVGSPASIDVAVLRLQDPINQPTLSLKDEYPAIGTPLTYNNYQSAKDAVAFNKQSQSYYPGVVQGYDSLGLEALTGLVQDKYKSTFNTSVQSGSSGGPVVDTRTGEVVGDVSTFVNNDWAATDSLTDVRPEQGIFGAITFTGPGVPKTHPEQGSLSPVYAIKAAMQDLSNR